MRSIKQVLDEVPADLEKGLDNDGVAQSFVRYGANRLTPLPRKPLWKKFLEKFDEPIIKILLAAALLSIVVDLFKAGPTLGGVALGVVVVVIGAGLATTRLRPWLPSLMFGLAIV